MSEPSWRAALRSLICVRLNDHGPQTNRELAKGCQLPVDNIAPRMSELEQGNLIYCVGLRKSASGRGRPVKVWALIQPWRK